MSDEKKPHIDDVRALMLEQLRALRSARPGEALVQELKRAKGVSELSQTFIDSARVEVEYVKATQGDGDVPFLAAPADGAPGLPPAAGEDGTAHRPFGRNVHRLGD